MKQITAGFLGMAFNYLKPVYTTEKLDSDQFVDSFINLCNNLADRMRSTVKVVSLQK